MKFEANVQTLPERRVASVRHIGAYHEIGRAIGRLCAWAGSRGLLATGDAEILGVYYDDPQTTDPAKLRSDACLTIPKETPVDGEVRAMTIPGGVFAVARVEVDPSEYKAAWDRLCREWIPSQGLTPDPDRLCYEIYRNDPEQHPQGRHIVDLCEPVLKR